VGELASWEITRTHPATDGMAVSYAARSSATNTMQPLSQPMTTLQNIQLGIAFAAIAKQEIAAPIGGYL
jgi:hypothetical protein